MNRLPRTALLAAGLTMALAGQPVPPAKEGQPTAATVPPPVTQEGIDGVVESRRIPYNPTLRRDPFATTSETRAVNKLDNIDDVSVLGRLVARGKTLGIIVDSRGVTKFIPAGFQFNDGALVSIEPTQLVFRQWDPHTTNRNISKQVVKPFKREEGKR